MAPKANKNHNEMDIPDMKTLYLDEGDILLTDVPEMMTPSLVSIQEQLEQLDREHLSERQKSNRILKSTPGSFLKKRLQDLSSQLLHGGGDKDDESLATIAQTYFAELARRDVDFSAGKRIFSSFPGEGEGFDDDDSDDEDDYQSDIIGKGEYFGGRIDNLDFSSSSSSPSHSNLLYPDQSILENVEFLERPVEVLDDDKPFMTQQERIDFIKSATDGPPNITRFAPLKTPSLKPEQLHHGAILLLDHLLKIISDPSQTSLPKMEKIKSLCAVMMKQNEDLHQENTRNHEFKQRAMVQRQILEMELDKANTIKNRLESLCRDLHIENRKLKAPGAAGTTKVHLPEFELPSFEAIKKFDIPPIAAKSDLCKQSVKNLADRLLKIGNLYKEREAHFINILKAKEVEIYQNKSKCKNLTVEVATLKSALSTSNKRLLLLTKNEKELKEQVRQYVEKFRQVEETLGKSNDLFGTFRSEMESMGQKLAKLETENTQLTAKCSTLSRNIIEMADERTKANQAISSLKKQKSQLETLCRTLQSERNSSKPIQNNQ